MQGERLEKQIKFIIEIDKLKQIYRKTKLMDGSRRENDAEHSWHLAVMAILLSEHSNDNGIDILRVIKMVLVHDLVEIDAGDTYCYDEKGNIGKYERECSAADRLFGMLPEDQTKEFRDLWEEFEKGHTPESRFANALDRFQPMLHNYITKGEIWRENGITSEKVLIRNEPVRRGSPILWEYAVKFINESIEKGYLKK
ncbi:MAG: HD domain-containing protein [Clostridia bacterium]|nr:HD domain-containing protein [Clostridia bacterium]